MSRIEKILAGFLLVFLGLFLIMKNSANQKRVTRDSSRSAKQVSSLQPGVERSQPPPKLIVETSPSASRSQPITKKTEVISVQEQKPQAPDTFIDPQMKQKILKQHFVFK